MPALATQYDFIKLSREQQRSPLHHGNTPENTRIHSVWLSNGPGCETINCIAGPSDTSARIRTEPVKVTDGDDREGAFVFSLRAFYRSLPDTVGRKQLAGLLAYGMRTYEFEEGLQKEPGNLNTSKRVKFAHQVAFGGKSNQTLSEAQGPSDLCSCIRSSIIGLLNAYRIGYVHGRLTIDCIVKSSPQIGYVLASDGSHIDGDAVEYSGILTNFSYCAKRGQEIRNSTDQGSEAVNISTPTVLIANPKGTIHSPVHDLESTLWILVYHIANIVQRFVTSTRRFDEELPDLEDLRDLPQLIDEMPFPGAKQATNTEQGASTRIDQNLQSVEVENDEKAHEHKRKASKAIEKEGELKRQRNDDPALHLQDGAEPRFTSSEMGDEDIEMGENAISEVTPKFSEAVAADVENSSPPYEPLAKEILKMLEPVSDAQAYTNTREILLRKLDKLIEGNICLSPFRPLLNQLKLLAEEYHVKSVELQKMDAKFSFSSNEVEEAFARYLEAFRVHMPREDSWWYMKKYIQGIQENFFARQKKALKV